MIMLQMVNYLNIRQKIMEKAEAKPPQLEQPPIPHLNIKVSQ